MNRSQPANRSSATDAATGWKTALLVVGVALYLTAFYTAQPLRWQSPLVILLPDHVVSSWVGEDWGQFQVLDRLPIMAVASLILILAYLSGRLSMAAAGCNRDLSRLEAFVFSTAVGLAEWSLLTLAIGLTGGLHGPWLHLAAVGVMAGWAIWSLACRFAARGTSENGPGSDRPDRSQAHSRSRWTRIRGERADKNGQGPRAGSANGSGPPTAGGFLPWMASHGLWFGLPFLLLILLGAMLPPWDFDVREYHLQVPKEWYQAGRIGFLPHNVYGNMPLGAEMHALLGMVLMPGERSWWWGALAGKTVIAGFAPLTALGLLAAGRRFATPGAGVVAALVYLSIPWVVHVSQAGLIEGAVACYLFLAVYGVAIWAGEDGGPREEKDSPDTAISVPVPADREEVVRPPSAWSSRVFLAGFLAGAAAACKYPALLFVVAPLAIWTMFALGGCRWRPAALFLLAALCSCGPWYAKNWALTGNPVYPLVFGGVSRTPERIEQWNRAHRVPPDEFGRRYSAPQAIAAVADFGWGNLWQSPLLVPFAAAAFLGTRHRRLVLLLAAYAGFYLALWWLVTHRVDRFWVPVLPVAALLAGVGAAWPDSRVWRRAVPPLLLGGLAANLLFLSSAGVYDHRYLVSLEQLRHDEPAKPDTPSRVEPAHRYLNGMATAGDRVLLIGDAQPFDLEMPVVYDTCFDECRFERWMKDRSAAERRAVLRQERIAYVLVNWSEIERYRSPGNYGFTGFVTKPLVREELVRDQQILRPLALNVDPEQAELFEVVRDPKP